MAQRKLYPNAPDMNKDTVVASVIGFGLGLIAAIALWVVPRIIPKAATPAAPQKEVATTDVKGETVPTTQNFEITSHKDGDIVKETKLTLEGRAKGATLVIVSTPINDYVIKPTGDTFKAEMTLASGTNQIVVTSLTGEKEESKTLFIYMYEDPV